MIKKILLAALVAGSFGSATVPVSAATTIIVREAPPPPRSERMPAARRGYVWAPGHWEWRHNRHTWVRGAWIRDRKGYVYHAPAWEERDGQWHMQRGNWARRDKDGDGVPNGADARPNNPNRN